MDGVGKRVACLPSRQFQVHSEAADSKNEGLRLSATPVFELSLSGYMSLSALSTLGCLSGFRRVQASQFDTLSFCWFCVNEEIHADMEVSSEIWRWLHYIVVSASMYSQRLLHKPIMNARR